jgi:ketosteroid isomerase-like protein
VSAADIIAANEQAIAAAHVSLDLEAIDRLYHPEFIVVQPDGMIETKAEVLESYRSGDRHWDFAEIDRLHIQIAGNTAVAVGRWRARGVNGGERFDYAARFLSVWTYEDGAWRNLAYKAEEIPIEL